MMIKGWSIKYKEILKGFGYSQKKDLVSAQMLESTLDNSSQTIKINKLINNQLIFIVGAGPSLSLAIPILKKYRKIVKVVADSAVKPLIDSGIKPDIVVTDLDGDEKALREIGKSKTIFVTHAHGDNISKLDFIKNFKNCLGTTQTKPFGKIHNFGGFTDGDRSVFLASYFGAKKIILFGMDFGKRIGKFSNTKPNERKDKLKKLSVAKSLLEWLALNTKSELFTTSAPIEGFKKISYRELDTIIT